MTVTTETVARALGEMVARARGHGYETHEETAGSVACHLAGYTEHGAPRSASRELRREVSNALRRLERTGRIWSRVTKGMEHPKHHSRRKIHVRRRWYSTHVKEA